MTKPTVFAGYQRHHLHTLSYTTHFVPLFVPIGGLNYSCRFYMLNARWIYNPPQGVWLSCFALLEEPHHVIEIP